tara:strand:- start:1271 stop:1942 length:672 start_codon:yes stop_codon:yes gene_type:complete
MGRNWPDEQLDGVTTPGVFDARGKAVLRTLDRMIGMRQIAEFQVREADTCPASVLPALIAEHSMEEFIEVGLPERIQRRILGNAWVLQSLKGYDAGVKLGLELLGISAEIEHWHQTEPKGEPNTHRILIFVDQPVFANSATALDAREVGAIYRMVDACKRFSQESEIAFGVAQDAQINIGAVAAFGARVNVHPYVPSNLTIEASAEIGVVITANARLEINEAA